MSRKPISDLEIYSNLKRRSSGAHARWSREAFSARVGSKIDAGATSRRVSKAPALVGLVGIVAVLLVLVVALPALRSGPASTTLPSARPPYAAMSPAEFQVRFAAGELKGQTVLVNGRIEESDTGGILYGTYCTEGNGLVANDPAVADCVMGRLSGTEPALWPNAPYLAVGPDEWRAAVPPAEGALVLNVTENGFIEYIGTVAVTAGEPSSVRAASALDLESVELDEVVLVDASLTGVATRECPATPFRIRDLPSRGCEPSSLTDASGTLTVQDNAYFEFAPDAGPQPSTGAVTPRRAIYAVAKRLESCAEEPCWEWEVVARVGGEAAEHPTPMPTVNGANTLDCPGNANVVDRTRLVIGCLLEVIDRHFVEPGPVNPDGDLRRVRLEWETNVCVENTGVGAEVLEENGSLSVDIIERPIDDQEACDSPGAVAFEMLLSRDANASSVGFSVLHAQPYQQPIDAPGNEFECAGPPTPLEMTPVPEAFPTLIDETGLIVNCAEPDVGFEDTGRIRVDQLASSDNVVYVVWPAGACSGSVEFTLRVVGESKFELAGERPTECRPSSGANVVQITFSQPISPDDFHATIDGGDGAVDPAPQLSPSVVPGCSGVSDQTGLIERCEAVGGPDGEAHPMTVANPDGDLRKLEVAWADVCEYSGEFGFRRAGAGFELIAYSDRPINVQCDGFPQGHVVTLRLSEPVAAESVQISTPPSGIWECGSREMLGPSGDRWLVSVHDETGFVGSCGGRVPTPTPNGVTNPNGDLSQLLLRWTGGACATEANVTFSSAGDGYLAQIDDGADCLLQTGAPRSLLLLLFDVEIDASSVDLEVNGRV